MCVCSHGLAGAVANLKITESLRSTSQRHSAFHDAEASMVLPAHRRMPEPKICGAKVPDQRIPGKPASYIHNHGLRSINYGLRLVAGCVGQEF